LDFSFFIRVLVVDLNFLFVVISHQLQFVVQGFPVHFANVLHRISKTPVVEACLPFGTVLNQGIFYNDLALND
jgi:hypothetical protein